MPALITNDCDKHLRECLPIGEALTGTHMMQFTWEVHNSCSILGSHPKLLGVAVYSERHAGAKGPNYGRGQSEIGLLPS
jgi:hypothetical protein